ncbi:DNA polymerase/3'-5' exonuclease PolX [Kitasatospora atroaurantiaca]|uniref:DNA polymerase beta n=1 Tax=Kitasatospora atroaurantiaca TaxID=285545 RepID=A0A561EYT3_9ACTN|nr:DNA polymerase/3'-5' exonuclease PolX [Kitasatospora atroaurantiaca]TWE20766.1 DNA polymerase (family 10) [Kitasatospora atroaurantiaca]
MGRRNDEVEALLQEYADLILLTGGDAYRARSYEKAARAVGGHPGDVAHLDVKGLQEIPGVGKSIAAKIAEYLATGHLPAVDQLREKVPAGVREIMAIPGVGPKKAAVLHRDLGISSVAELLDAARADRLSEVPGFGERSAENILHGIEVLGQSGGRVLLNTATELAEEIVAELSRVPGCERCAYAGSLRRMRETIGDIDVLAAAEDSAPLMEALTALPYAADVIGHGTTKTSIRTTKGMQVDLRVVPADAWGAAMVYFTGSKAHNIRLRTRAVKAGLKLSEYGLFEVESGRKVVSASEEEVYAALGLPWIPPTLREDRGEIDAALRGELPEVVTERDVRGDLHTHTDLTDGLAPLEEMLATAAERGYAYYAVTDHAPNLYMQRMTDEKMLAQRQQVRELDRRFKGMRVLHGTELNIDPDGGVDWPPEFLAGFDLCVASVHSHFRAGRDAQTRRLVRACENPYVHIIGHPTTRLLGRRPGLDVDLDEVFAACARTGTVLEINASPERLDLNDEQILAARRHGVRFAVDSDAHSPLHLANLRYGIGTAQRGWLTKDDVINTWTWTRLRRLLNSVPSDSG